MKNFRRKFYTLLLITILNKALNDLDNTLHLVTSDTLYHEVKLNVISKALTLSFSF